MFFFSSTHPCFSHLPLSIFFFLLTPSHFFPLSSTSDFLDCFFSSSLTIYFFNATSFIRQMYVKQVREWKVILLPPLLHGPPTATRTRLSALWHVVLVVSSISKLFGNVFLFVWKNVYILYEKVAKCSCVDAIRKTVRIYRQLRLAQVFIHAWCRCSV